LDDYEKMAILDKAYDNMASVSKGSPFYKAVMSDDPNIGKYLDSQW
jgi:hypothetical protein